MRSKNCRGVEFQKSAIGGINHHCIGPEFGENFGLALVPDQRLRGGIGPENPGGMRIEGKHDRRAADLVGQFAQGFHQPRMTAMHAVEIAYRYGAAAQISRENRPSCGLISRLNISNRQYFSQRRKMQRINLFVAAFFGFRMFAKAADFVAKPGGLLELLGGNGFFEFAPQHTNLAFRAGLGRLLLAG